VKFVGGFDDRKVNIGVIELTNVEFVQIHEV
jgi:hypothetical protein